MPDRAQPASLDDRIWQSDDVSKDDTPPRPTAHPMHLLEQRFLALHRLLEGISDVVFDIVSALADKVASRLIEADTPSLDLEDEHPLYGCATTKSASPSRGRPNSSLPIHLT
jgi:hypothetical protein